MAPGDEFCFIASIEPLPGAYAKFFALKTRNFDSNVLLTWGMEATQGRMLSSYDLHWSAPECREFLLSVSCKSPVLRNSVFPVCFTVTNLSSETQDLVITIGTNLSLGFFFNHVRSIANVCCRRARGGHSDAQARGQQRGELGDFS